MRGTHTYTHNPRFQFRVRFSPQQSIGYSFFWHSSNMSSPTTGEGILRMSSLNLSLVIYFYCLSFVRLCIEGIEKVLEKTPSGFFRRRVFFPKRTLLLREFIRSCSIGVPFSKFVRKERVPPIQWKFGGAENGVGISTCRWRERKCHDD